MVAHNCRRVNNYTTPDLKSNADDTQANEMIIPKKMPLEQKKKKAKELYNSGWSYSQIAKYFGVRKSTVYNWIHDYPYRKRRPDQNVQKGSFLIGAIS